MKTVATNKKLRELLVGIENGSLIPRPDFQRRLVWTNAEKVAFIHTVLKDYPFPEIYIAAGDVDEKTGIATEYLVDGQQRITTLYQYFKGDDEIVLPSNFPNYGDLLQEEKVRFLQYDVVVRDLGDLSIDEIKGIFQTINSTSYSLNAMEIDNARFDGDFKKFGDEFAENEFFKEIELFTINDVRRMQDTRYCLTLVATMLGGYFNASSKLEQYLPMYNEVFEKKSEIIERVNATINYIKSLNLDSNSRAWNKADFFTVFVEVDRLIRNGEIDFDVQAVSERLSVFFAALERGIKTGQFDEDQSKYYNAAIQGSNSRSRRIERAEVIEKIFKIPE